MRKTSKQSAMQYLLAVAAVISVLVLVSGGAQAQVGQGPPQEISSSLGRWVRLAPMPEKNEEFNFATANNKLYVIGGNGDGPKGLVMEYDPAADKWTKKKNLPFTADHMAVTEYNGKIYAFGGATQSQAAGPGNIALNTSWEYDPVADSWKSLAPMPTRRVSAVAAAVGGKIYVLGGAGHHPGAKDLAAPIGGNTPHRSLDANEAYDPATNRWETRMTMPTPRNHAAIGVANNKIYVIGGRVASVFVVPSNNVDVVEEYDPATDSWGASKARMPIATSGAAFGSYRGKIYVAGGESQNPEGLTAYRALQEYDAAANRWTILPSMPLPRNGPAGAVVGSRFHVVSGHLQSGSIGGPQLNTEQHDAFELRGR